MSLWSVAALLFQGSLQRGSCLKFPFSKVCVVHGLCHQHALVSSMWGTSMATFANSLESLFLLLLIPALHACKGLIGSVPGPVAGHILTCTLSYCATRMHCFKHVGTSNGNLCKQSGSSIEPGKGPMLRSVVVAVDKTMSSD
jgi:hypothetical protein